MGPITGKSTAPKRGSRTFSRARHALPVIVLPVIVLPVIVLALAGLPATTTTAYASVGRPALAKVPAVCGNGINLRGCPPFCVKLLRASAIAKIFHVPHLSAASWHVDGEPQDTCTYGANAGSTVSETVDPKTTVAQFGQEVTVTKEFEPRAKVQQLPMFGKHAVYLADCMGADMCFPNAIVLSKGYLVEVNEALNGVPLAQMTKIYLPEVEALVKAILAKA